MHEVIKVTVASIELKRGRILPPYSKSKIWAVQ